MSTSNFEMKTDLENNKQFPSMNINTNYNKINYDYITIFYCIMFMIFMIFMELCMENVFSFSSKLKNNHLNMIISSTLLPDWITLFQFFWCFIISFIQLNYQFKLTRNFKLLYYYVILALLIFCASGMATMSLNYVSYPTKVVFKSAKLVPAMIISTIIIGNYIQ